MDHQLVEELWPSKTGRLATVWRPDGFRLVGLSEH